MPVPVFLPTTLQGAEEIIESINELKNNVTSDLQPVTENLEEDRKEGKIVLLSFPLSFKGNVILFLYLKHLNVYFHLSFSVGIYLALRYRCEDDKGEERVWRAGIL